MGSLFHNLRPFLDVSFCIDIGSLQPQWTRGGFELLGLSSPFSTREVRLRQHDFTRHWPMSVHAGASCLTVFLVVDLDIGGAVVELYDTDPRAPDHHHPIDSLVFRFCCNEGGATERTGPSWNRSSSWYRGTACHCGLMTLRGPIRSLTC